MHHTTHLLSANQPRLFANACRIAAKVPRLSAKLFRAFARVPRIAAEAPRPFAKVPRSSADAPRMSANPFHLSVGSCRPFANEPRLSAEAPRLSASKPRMRNDLANDRALFADDRALLKINLLTVKYERFVFANKLRPLAQLSPTLAFIRVFLKDSSQAFAFSRQGIAAYLRQFAAMRNSLTVYSLT